jgi:O-antigen/teichoic acid export membrane protein
MAGATLLTGVNAAQRDVLVLAGARSMTEAGQYAAAFRLYLMLCVVPKLLLVPAYPRFAAVSENRVALQKEINRFGRISLGVGLLAAALTWTLSAELTVLLFGASFAPAAPIVRLLSIASVIVLLSAPFPSVLLASRQTGTALLCFASGLAVSVAINLTATPIWGMPAAASAVILAEIAVLVTGWQACRIRLGLSLWSETSAEICSAIVIALSAILFRNWVLPLNLGAAATIAMVSITTTTLWCAVTLARRRWKTLGRDRR